MLRMSTYKARTLRNKTRTSQGVQMMKQMSVPACASSRAVAVRYRSDVYADRQVWGDSGPTPPTSGMVIYLDGAALSSSARDKITHLLSAEK